MSNVKLKVLVVGATGSIGSLVVKEAVRQGHKVRALVRSESKGRQLPSEAEAVAGDLTRSESLAVAVQGMEAISCSHTVPTVGTRRELKVSITAVSATCSKRWVLQSHALHS